MLKLCAAGTFLSRMFTIGAAKDAPAEAPGKKGSARKGNLRARNSRERGAPQENWRLVPNWEARNHFCTEMGQALRKHSRRGREDTTATFRFPRQRNVNIEFSIGWPSTRGTKFACSERGAAENKAEGMEHRVP